MTEEAEPRVDMTGRLRFWGRIVAGVTLSASSAVLLFTAFPPYPLWPFVFAAAVPFLVAQHRVLPKKWSSLAPAIAIGGWMGMYFSSIFGFGGGGAWYMRALPLFIGAFVFLAERGTRTLHERTAYRWFVPQGVFGWIGFEMIRSFIPNMGTWAFVGYPLYAQLWFIQPISIFGIFGLDMLIILINFMLAQAAIALFDRKCTSDPSRAVTLRSAWMWAAAASTVLVVWAGLGLALYSTDPRSDPALRVAAVQPNFPRAAHLDTHTSQETRLGALAAQTRAAASQGAQVVVWPELGLGFDPQSEHTGDLRALAAETHTYIVIGYGLMTGRGFRNEVTVLSPTGEFLGVYGKAHPVVFGGEPYGLNTGTFPVYSTPVGRLATIICYDLNFTDATRRLASQGAQFIAAPSLDFPGISELQYSQMVLRAVENRVAMAKADAAYDSAIVDPYGHIVRWVARPEAGQALVIADVPLGTGNTPYSRFGDWVGWVNLIGMLVFMVPNLHGAVAGQSVLGSDRHQAVEVSSSSPDNPACLWPMAMDQGVAANVGRGSWFSVREPLPRETRLLRFGSPFSGGSSRAGRRRREYHVVRQAVGGCLSRLYWPA